MRKGIFFSEFREDKGDFFCNNAPVEEDGWQFLADIFSDVRPDPLPEFHAGREGGEISDLVPDFASPMDAFLYFFDSASHQAQAEEDKCK